MEGLGIPYMGPREETPSVYVNRCTPLPLIPIVLTGERNQEREREREGERERARPRRRVRPRHYRRIHLRARSKRQPCYPAMHNATGWLAYEE